MSYAYEAWVTLGTTVLSSLYFWWDIALKNKKWEPRGLIQWPIVAVLVSSLVAPPLVTIWALMMHIGNAVLGVMVMAVLLFQWVQWVDIKFSIHDDDYLDWDMRFDMKSPIPLWKRFLYVLPSVYFGYLFFLTK